jgi:fumarylacetoacetase
VSRPEPAGTTAAAILAGVYYCVGVWLLIYVWQHEDPQALDIHLTCGIQAADMDEPHTVCTTNSKAMYYSMAQQLCHHSLTGCNMQPGDLLGTGTISGNEGQASFGSMLEISWKGTRSVTLSNGEERKFLKNGDTVVMRGVCEGDGYKIGWGDCSGQIVPNPME